jgi:hypothetical protein
MYAVIPRLLRKYRLALIPAIRSKPAQRTLLMREKLVDQVCYEYHVFSFCDIIGLLLYANTAFWMIACISIDDEPVVVLDCVSHAKI